MTAVLSAMKRELSRIIGYMKIESREVRQGIQIHRGRVDGEDVVAAATGVGKTLAALAAQHVIDTYAPERILYTGIGGSLNPDLVPGDVIVAEDTVQWDFDTTFFGFQRGRIPFTSWRFLPSDRELVIKALETPAEVILKLTGGKIRSGRILTGDSFVSDKNSSAFQLVMKSLGGDAVDMEGAAAGLAAAVHGIPFLLVRVISDAADGKHPLRFGKFLSSASGASLAVLRQVLKGA